MNHQESVQANRDIFDNSYDKILAMNVISGVFASSIVNFDVNAPRKQSSETEEPIDTEKVMEEFGKLNGKIPGNLLKPDLKIIDFACGTGLVGEKLAQFIPQGELLGIDITPLMLETFDARAEVLTKKYPGFKMSSICADVMDDFDIEKYEGYADVLICTLAFHHIHAYEEVAEVIKRLVKPGGWILIYDFYNEDLEDTREEMTVRNMARHGLTFDEMNSCLEKNCENVSSVREFRINLWHDEGFIESHCKESVRKNIHNAPQKDGLYLVPSSVILGLAQKK